MEFGACSRTTLKVACSCHGQRPVVLDISEKLYKPCLLEKVVKRLKNEDTCNRRL